MSTALGLAGVTAVLEALLKSIYATSGLPPVTVSAVAPDIVQANLSSVDAAQLQVNVFLHQVTPNPSWRNAELPSLAPDGTTRLDNPPLALDLHYLLTAYASEDCEAEALLGLAVQFMHETPVLPRDQIRKVLANLPTTLPLRNLISSSQIADQIEMIKITSATLGREELAWLWTALKADYRPTFPFQVSVVLIRSQRPLVTGLPVLSRNVNAVSSLETTLPTLSELATPQSQPTACLGDIVTVSGASLGSVGEVVLSNSRLGISQAVPVLGSAQDASFRFTVPNPSLPAPQPNPTDLPAGVYVLIARVPQGSDLLATNALPFAIAPKIDAAWPPGNLTAGSGVTVTVPCSPWLRAGQQVSLLIGNQETPANPFSPTINAPSFTFATLEPTNQPVPVRLRVDGIDSPIIDMSQTPPVYVGPFVQVS